MSAAVDRARAYFESADVLAVEPHGDDAAVVVRRVDLGGGIPSHLCGYAVLPDPCPGVSVENVGADCHGGVTYDEVDDGWRVVGFDCAHYGDRNDPTLTPEWALREAHALADWMIANGPALAVSAEVSL